eukprot:TRINITY_DN3174_c0_g1_i1.p1 TRINITY_DN3174_c0_g1~~TRINITY_DN3174_c0_g1_i1.p1  ORF type:complete len:538 (+),score=165.34 TRINITY_DN3174_c0_g1_i1:483-2096(+)
MFNISSKHDQLTFDRNISLSTGDSVTFFKLRPFVLVESLNMIALASPSSVNFINLTSNEVVHSVPNQIGNVRSLQYDEQDQMIYWSDSNNIISTNILPPFENRTLPATDVGFVMKQGNLFYSLGWLQLTSLTQYDGNGHVIDSQVLPPQGANFITTGNSKNEIWIGNYSSIYTFLRISVDGNPRSATSHSDVSPSDGMLTNTSSDAHVMPIVVGILVPVILIGIILGAMGIIWKFRRNSYKLSEAIELGRSWEIDYDALIIKEELGHGSFGVVNLAVWRNSPCVVKTFLHEDVSQQFQQEIRSMTNLRPHPNVCKLLGVCTDPGKPLCLVMEYLAGNSLEKALWEGKINLTRDMTLQVARDIASGMNHLHSENIVHCDLALRNILISGSRRNFISVKVSDFGLARHLTDLKKNQSFPPRWTSPENLNGSENYFKQNDVWAFGVTLWEIITIKRPYWSISSNEEVIRQVIAGMRLDMAEIEDEFLHRLISSCWKPAEDRPTFADLIASIDLESKAMESSSPRPTSVKVDPDSIHTYMN